MEPSEPPQILVVPDKAAARGCFSVTLKSEEQDQRQQQRAQ
jgi:hypothetical protein